MDDLNSTSATPQSEAQNIMSFLTTATATSTTPNSSAFAAKHIIRQEGFHPSSPGANTTPPPPGSSSGSTAGGYELFNSFLPDPFRKFPGSNGPADFSEELASLMQQDNRSSSSSNGSAGASDRFSRPHNIFDISAPATNGNSSSSTSDYPTHFNQTLPALNSSLRYEPDPQQQQQHQPPPPPPPSSFHHPFNRHTPSPTSLSSSLPHTTASRSRSRSRPPSGGDQSANTSSGSTGGIGPARTTRSRRNNSVSGTSPPPGGRPHAIVIPRSRAATVSGGAPGVTHANQWFSMTGHSAAAEYSLPTPESLASPLLSHSHSNHSHSHSLHSPANHHLSHSIPHGSPPLSHSPVNHHTNNANGQQQQHPYSSFSLSPPPEPSSAVHLPPVSSLSHQNNFNVMAGSPSSPHSLPTIHSNMHNIHGSMHHNAGMGMGGSNGMMNGNSGHHHTNSIGHGHTSSVGSTGAFISSMANGLPQQNGSAAPPLSAAEKQAAIANEKRRRRRESHNAVERRRRDNINEKISELATLIPECMLDPATTNGAATSPIATINPSSPILPGQPIASNNSDDAGSPGGAGSDSNPSAIQQNGDANGTSPTNPSAANSAANAGGVVKANKGMILRKSVDYIRYLQQLVEAQGARNRLLEAELKSWREGGEGKVTDPSALNINTSMTGQWGGYTNGWLPTMPEGGEPEEDDDQDGDDVDMDDSDDNEPKRRGRGVVNGKKGGSKKKLNGTIVKEEMPHGVEGEMMVM